MPRARAVFSAAFGAAGRAPHCIPKAPMQPPLQVASPTRTQSVTLIHSGLTNETSRTKLCPQYPTMYTRPTGSSASEPQRHLKFVRPPPDQAPLPPLRHCVPLRFQY